MILNHTRKNFCTLGALLWWPAEPVPSTGLLQGISLTCDGDSCGDIYLARYYRGENSISMVFSLTPNGGAPEILCSLVTDIPQQPTVFELVGESPAFVQGAVLLAATIDKQEPDISGAQVSPFCISWVDTARTISSTEVFQLMSGGTALDSANMSDLYAINTSDVRGITTPAELQYTTADIIPIIPASGIIERINGSAIPSGTHTITLPDCWTVSGGGVAAYIDGPVDSTCATANYISDQLSPVNHPQATPLDKFFVSAVYSGGVLQSSGFYGADTFVSSGYVYSGGSVISSGANWPNCPDACNTQSGGRIVKYYLDADAIAGTRFNADYEAGGLAWSSYSSKHDII